MREHRATGGFLVLIAGVLVIVALSAVATVFAAEIAPGARIELRAREPAGVPLQAEPRPSLFGHHR